MGISIWQLLIVLVIALLIFGSKKLRFVGSDLGAAVRGFKSSMKDGSAESAESAESGGPDSENVAKLEIDDESVLEGDAAKKEQERA